MAVRQAVGQARELLLFVVFCECVCVSVCVAIVANGVGGSVTLDSTQWVVQLLLCLSATA